MKNKDNIIQVITHLKRRNNMKKVDLCEGSNASINNPLGVLHTYQSMLERAIEYKGRTTILNNKIDENMLNALRNRIDQLKNKYSIKYGKKGYQIKVPLSEKMSNNAGYYRTNENDVLVYVSAHELKTSLQWLDHPDNHFIRPRKK